MAANTKPNMIRIRLKRSTISTPGKLKKVVQGLGLRKINQVVERPDGPATRGMVAKVPHLVEIVE
jgi:large subunit ribosomal protein L30